MFFPFPKGFFVSGSQPLSCLRGGVFTPRHGPWFFPTDCLAQEPRTQPLFSPPGSTTSKPRGLDKRAAPYEGSEGGGDLIFPPITASIWHRDINRWIGWVDK